MKHYTNLITRLLVVAVVCFLTMGTITQAQLLNENFSYSTGQLDAVNGGANVSGGAWINYSGTTLPIQVTSGSLTYSGYAASGIGNKVVIVPGSAEDAYTQFATQTSGTVYAAFLVNFTTTTGMTANTSTTGDYSFAFIPSTSTSALDARVSVRVGSVAGTYNLGLRATSTNTASTFKSTDYATGGTHLIVISYQFVAGTTNDVMNMWIDPAIGGSEPVADLTQTGLATDLADVARFVLRQGTNSVNAEVDGIRVGTSWGSVAGSVGSTSSDIVAANGETANIPYASFQLASITTTSDAQKVWSFTVRDGAGAGDADALPTILTAVTITKGASDNTTTWANTIRKAALFDGSTKVAEINVTGETMAFTGLTVTAPDEGSKTLDLYLTFEANVTDNQQLQFQVTSANATAQGFNASTFSSFSSFSSDVTGDNNRLEVTATQLTFTTQPPVTVAQNNEFAVGVTAQDGLGSTDLDYTTDFTVGVATGTGIVSSVAGLTKTPSSGVASWSDLTYNTVEGGVQLSASSGALTPGTSNAFAVVALSAASDVVAGPDVEPTNISSLEDSQGEEKQVFDVILRDGGGSPDGDGVATKVTALQFVQGSSNNTADWTQYVQGAELFKSGVSLGTGTVGATSISFSGVPLFTVPDDGSDTLQLKIWVKSSLPAGADNKVINVKVNQNSGITVDPTGSLFANGGVDVEAGATYIDVEATAISFNGTIGTQANGVGFATSVTGKDANANIDADYVATVDLTVATGTGTISGGTSASATAGTASFSGVIITGGGSHSLLATAGALTATSNTFIVTSPSVFKVANYTPPFNKAKTVFTGPDTLTWDDPNTWSVVSGYDANNIPDADDDVILDNDNKAGSYVVKIGSSSLAVAKTIRVGYSGNSNTLVALIPTSNAQVNALTIGDGQPGNYDIDIQQGGQFINAGGLASGTNLFIVGFSPAKDSILVRPGGKFVHATKAASSYMFRTSQDFNGNYGIIEYDVPDSTTTYQYAASGAFYPNMVMSANAAGGKKAYKPTASSGFGYLYVKGNLTVNPGVTDTVGNPCSDSLALYGNLTNYGTFTSVPTPPTNASSTIFAGSNGQEVIGNPITFYNGFVIKDIANVSLQTEVTVAGGQATVTLGTLNATIHTVYLGQNGSLNEVNGTIMGHVSATRTLSQNTNENFGNIGFEINSLGAVPGVTTVLRTTGEFIISSQTTNQSIKRYFDVTSAGTPPFNATTVFHYNDDELNGNNESDLFQHQSTDGGTTWKGKSGTNSTTLNKVTTTSIQSFSRFTLASATNALYATHTITMKKFEDNDGDLNTPGVAKKWFMSLYENSIDPVNLVNAQNLSVVPTNNLPAGTYICAETDSAGWSHVGHYVDNGFTQTLFTDTRSFDTIVVSNGVSGSFEFYNSRSSSITINKLRDLDGDPLTTADQTAKSWGLTLYKDTVGGTPVAQGNTNSLVAGDLGTGMYIGVEADSMGWYRCDGSTKYDTLMLTGNTNLTMTFINVKANTIVVRKWADADGNVSTTSVQTAKAWQMDVHTGSPTGTFVFGGNTNTSVSNSNLPDATYYITEADSSTWVSLGQKVNGVFQTGSEGTKTAMVTLADGQSDTVDFYNAPPMYGQMFRALNPDSIALEQDNLGKVGKSVKAKATRVEFSFLAVVGATGATGLHIEFNQAVDTSFAFTSTPTATMTNLAKLTKWHLAFSSPLSSGDTVVVSGYGMKGAAQKVSKYFWTLGGTQTGANLKNPTFTRNVLRLPMPNRINLVEETYAQGAFTATKGMVIGVAQANKDSAKKYAWVVLAKAADAVKNLSITKMKIVNLHDGTPRGLDSIVSGSKMKNLVGKQTAFQPTKQDNILFANLVALKLSIAASALDKTPVGFGELILNDTAANPWNGLTLAQLSAKADTLMTGYAGRTFESAGTYAKLASTVRNILDAFEGVIDTVSFSGKLATTGTHKLIECKILKANPSATPARIIPTAVAELPETYALYQNYPNPFNPTTTIQFDLPFASSVTLKIFNILGQEVATLLNHQDLSDGTQAIEFNASNFASGVYLYRISAENTNEDGVTNTFTSVKKMMLLK